MPLVEDSGGCLSRRTQASYMRGGKSGDDMADLYLKALESERKSLWAECRLKGLAKDTPQRLRILELDGLLQAHKAKKQG
jgi:hypothetical protein